MIVGVPTETFPGERRVALVPASVSRLAKAGVEVVVQSGAGDAAGFTDEGYQSAGARVVQDRAEVFHAAEAVLQVRTPGANPDGGSADLEQVKSEQLLVGHAEPLTAHDWNDRVCQTGATLAAVELMPRITRAQSMDALSSQANLAGYKAVLLAASILPKIFPMMMTAAGTIRPARVFVIGAGVAGLQAIATEKRLGAAVSATDIRPEVAEQVQSLGAKFVTPEETAAGEGGYAAEQSEEQKRRQRELMEETVAESDVVITTAAVPGKRAPVLVTEAMVQKMAPRSVVVDLAAERGGNCELTEAGETVEKHGVSIVGTTNVPAAVPFDASRMYANNLVNLLEHLLSDGQVQLDMNDPITAGVVVCRGGTIVHPKVREMMGLTPLEGAESQGSEKP